RSPSKSSASYTSSATAPRGRCATTLNQSPENHERKLQVAPDGRLRRARADGGRARRGAAAQLRPGQDARGGFLREQPLPRCDGDVEGLERAAERVCDLVAL